MNGYTYSYSDAYHVGDRSKIVRGPATVGNLYFAGEALSETSPGYMNGAVETAVQTAQRVSKNLACDIFTWTQPNATPAYAFLRKQVFNTSVLPSTRHSTFSGSPIR